MCWKYEYTATFKDKISELRHDYHKKAVAQAFKTIKQLEHPKDAGGEYMRGWAYNVGEKSILQCQIDEDNRIVTFTNFVQ